MFRPVLCPDFQWVQGDVCEVQLMVHNPMPFELRVENMVRVPVCPCVPVCPRAVLLLCRGAARDPRQRLCPPGLPC